MPTENKRRSFDPCLSCATHVIDHIQTLRRNCSANSMAVQTIIFNSLYGLTI